MKKSACVHFFLAGCLQLVSSGPETFFNILLGGTKACVRDFVSQNFEQKPLLIGYTNRSERNRKQWADQYSDLLSIPIVSDIVDQNSTVFDVGEQRKPLRYGHGYDLFLGRSREQADGEKWTEVVPANQLAADGRSLVPGVVTKGLQRGFSLIMNKMEMRHRPVADVAVQLQAFFGAHANANLYITPQLGGDSTSENQGFEIHWDEMESFIVQIVGRKHWHVYQKMLDLPMPHQRIKPKAAEAGAVSLDIDLSPGDVLYLPRGWIHDARTINSGSLHLTLGVQMEKHTLAHLVHALADLVAEEKVPKNVMLQAISARKGSPRCFAVMHVLIQAVANKTAEWRASIPIGEPLLRTFQELDPEYSVEAELQRALGELADLVVEGQALPFAAKYVLQPRGANVVGPRDPHLPQKGPLADSLSAWASRVTESGAGAEEQLQSQQRLMAATKTMQGAVSTPSRSKEVIKSIQDGHETWLQLLRKAMMQSLSHHGQDTNVGGNAAEELRH
ncbi:hypothetical protein CYMTET_40209 [Cymbomonas tetramitiformis]|uniref:Bifunctional lysine-specific demethylase and histidyl-hydroxylase n=1 Tax=Cymbomonas tetramitiformis TaxID=36881 RepID=A0AAE0CAP9_9CHLO|nr:hypothetical protein CYMTET_40209 [Cymbomonas tetramitiformis]